MKYCKTSKSVRPILRASARIAHPMSAAGELRFSVLLSPWRPVAAQVSQWLRVRRLAASVAENLQQPVDPAVLKIIDHWEANG